MKKLSFLIGEEHGRKHHDAAIVLDGEDPREALVDAAIQSIAIDVFLTLGDVTIHLAAIMDPDHWSEDWEAAGIEDADEFLAGLVTETT